MRKLILAAVAAGAMFSTAQAHDLENRFIAAAFMNNCIKEASKQAPRAVAKTYCERAKYLAIKRDIPTTALKNLSHYKTKRLVKDAATYALRKHGLPY